MGSRATGFAAQGRNVWDSHPTGDPIEIPPTFGDRLAAAYDLDEPPATVWEWWRLEDNRSDRSEPVTLEDAALAEPSGHEVVVDGELGHVPCVLDALAVAVRGVSRPAVVRTRDPRTHRRVTVAVGSDSVAAVPPGAVIALAIDASESLDGSNRVGRRQPIVDRLRERDDEQVAPIDAAENVDVSNRTVVERTGRSDGQRST